MKSGPFRVLAPGMIVQTAYVDKIRPYVSDNVRAFIMNRKFRTWRFNQISNKPKSVQPR